MKEQFIRKSFQAKIELRGIRKEYDEVVEWLTAGYD